MEVIFHGQETGEHDRGAAKKTSLHVVQADLMTGVVHQSANHAGQGIDLLAEDERHFVDEHVAEYTATRSGEGTHDDGSPEGETRTDGLFDTCHSEEGQTNGVEKEPGIVLPNQETAEYDNPDQGDGRTDEVEGVGHPEGGLAEQQVAHGAAANGGGDTYHIGTEQVKLLGRSQTYAGYGEGQRTYEVQDLYEC